MSATVVDLADRRPAVFYTVRIRHNWDDSLSIAVDDVAADDRSRRSVADALRRAADKIESGPVEVTSQ